MHVFARLGQENAQMSHEFFIIAPGWSINRGTRARARILDVKVVKPIPTVGQCG